MKVIQKRVQIDRDGVIEIQDDELSVGSIASVIVMINDQNSPPPSESFSQLFGSVRGGFKTCEEADAFIRHERDSWGI